MPAEPERASPGTRRARAASNGRALKYKELAMTLKTAWAVVFSVLAGLVPVVVFGWGDDRHDERHDRHERERLTHNDRHISRHAERLVEEGRRIFRFDTFGSEAFWGGTLRL